MINTTKQPAYVAPYASVIEFETELNVIMARVHLLNMNGEVVYDEEF